MSIIGLELCDAGVMAIAGSPARLLAVDGKELQSQGYAIADNKQLVVGNEAAHKAHLFPVQVNSHYWDLLNTDPLEQNNRYARNHAEMAFSHLAQIWENVKSMGNQVIIAVPDHYDREQLGLILGMAQELSIPVIGFVAMSVAASSRPRPDTQLLHLDIHLHRLEITILHQGEQLTRQDSLTIQEISIEQLHRSWVDSIAEEFVRTTRFDPLHQAVTEQEVHNRLQAALGTFETNSSVIFEIANRKHSYRITLLRDLLQQKSEPIYDEVCRTIDQMRKEHGIQDTPTVLQLTHRITALPGFREKLAGMDNTEIIDLEAGAGALGALDLWDGIGEQRADQAASFYTSRPWHLAVPQHDAIISNEKTAGVKPTHLLYNSIAYPLSARPLIIGCDRYPAGEGIEVQTQSPEIDRKHCTVQRRAEGITITNHSARGTFVDNQPVAGETALELGQVIRLSATGEAIRLIACLNTDET